MICRWFRFALRNCCGDSLAVMHKAKRPSGEGTQTSQQQLIRAVESLPPGHHQATSRWKTRPAGEFGPGCPDAMMDSMGSMDRSSYSATRIWTRRAKICDFCSPSAHRLCAPVQKFHDRRRSWVHQHLAGGDRGQGRCARMIMRPPVDVWS
jgi:hypothetical protein